MTLPETGAEQSAGPLIEVAPLDSEEISSFEKKAVEEDAETVSTSSTNESTPDTTSDKGSPTTEEESTVTEAPINLPPDLSLTNFLNYTTEFYHMNETATFAAESSDPESEPVTVRFYHVQSTIACNESTISSWTEIASIDENNATITFTFNTPGMHHFCFSASDESSTVFEKVPTIFNAVDSTGMQLWLTADLGITDVSGKVSAWSDQSGQSHHANQALEANQPQIVTDELGRNAVSFSGSEFFSDAHT